MRLLLMAVTAGVFTATPVPAAAQQPSASASRIVPEYYATLTRWLDSLGVVRRKDGAQSAGPITPARSATLSIPVQFHTLGNGLKVVLSPDASVPLARVGLYYAAGPRQERRGRGGFAHLFEHLMFEGSAQLGPGEFFELVSSNGGRFGARTLYDFTKYNVTIPSNALELILWAESDRMRGLRIDQARLDAVRATVKNEVRQQSFNRPYGRFVWIDIPELAQTRWENSHSIYGESPDGSMADLDSASVADAEAFFRAYYTPANAILVVQGDFDSRQALSRIRHYFEDIPRRPAPPAPDRSEPRQLAEKRFSPVDPNAPRPALAISYHLPPRSNPAFWDMGIINQILIEGRDSWMHRALVEERNLTEAIYGGLSAQHGSMYTINGPNFWTAFAFHDKSQSPDSLLAVMDHEIARLQAAPVDSATLARNIIKARAEFYAELGAGRNDGIVDMLGQLALFGDHPSRINRIEDEFRSVTAERVLAAAREYLRPGNRTVLVLNTRDSK